MIWTAPALQGVQGVFDYLAPLNPRAAVALTDRLRRAGESLADFPERGRLTRRGTRELTIVSPYIISYDVVGDDVMILTIRHGAQRPMR